MDSRVKESGGLGASLQLQKTGTQRAVCNVTDRAFGLMKVSRGATVMLAEGLHSYSNSTIFRSFKSIISSAYVTTTS